MFTSVVWLGFYSWSGWSVIQLAFKLKWLTWGDEKRRKLLLLLPKISFFVVVILFNARDFTHSRLSRSLLLIIEYKQSKQFIHKIPRVSYLFIVRGARDHYSYSVWFNHDLSPYHWSNEHECLNMSVSKAALFAVIKCPHSWHYTIFMNTFYLVNNLNIVLYTDLQ